MKVILNNTEFYDHAVKTVDSVNTIITSGSELGVPDLYISDDMNGFTYMPNWGKHLQVVKTNGEDDEEYDIWSLLDHPHQVRFRRLGSGVILLVEQTEPLITSPMLEIIHELGDYANEVIE